MEKFIKNLPKAELHLHIEGTLQPELMLQLAQRNNVSIPYTSVDEIYKQLQYTCLQDFLDLYYNGTSVLLHEQDFFDLTFAYLLKCKEENILHTEIMFDPQAHTQRGVPFECVINGISRACETAKAQWGMSSLLIMSYLRHLSEEAAFETLTQSLPFKERIFAVGLDSSENGNPPSKFKNVFEASKKEGYRLTAHAGEEGTFDYIWEALNLLQVERIDHGNACLEDEKLLNYLIEHKIPLTLCPTSNVALKVIQHIHEHPVKTLLNKGVIATINSDDPAYFGGYLNENYWQAYNHLHLTKEEVTQLARNSFEYSFLSPAEKEKFIAKIDDL